MNYFEEFAKNSTNLDIALYLGLLIVGYVLFKDKIPAVTEYISKIVKQITTKKAVVVDNEIITIEEVRDEDAKLFFDLVKSWKTTKDLAEDYGATRAVEIADEMFPHLVPTEDVNDE
jgi:glutamine synthetase type III